MARNPALGYPTQAALRAAIKAIVDPKPTGVEFFDPLLQRLFIERPYHVDPPGPTFTRFRYVKRTLPNGVPIDRVFETYNAEQGWMSRSWNKCVDGRKFNVVFEFKRFARWRVVEIAARYQMGHPGCEWKADDKHYGPLDVHHLIPMRTIVGGALALMSGKDWAEFAKADWAVSDDFEILDRLNPVKHVLARHAGLGCLMTLCKGHHYAIEGKKHGGGGQP